MQKSYISQLSDTISQWCKPVYSFQVLEADLLEKDAACIAVKHRNSRPNVPSSPTKSGVNISEYHLQEGRATSFKPPSSSPSFVNGHLPNLALSSSSLPPPSSPSSRLSAPSALPLYTASFSGLPPRAPARSPSAATRNQAHQSGNFDDGFDVDKAPAGLIWPTTLEASRPLVGLKPDLKRSSAEASSLNLSPSAKMVSMLSDQASGLDLNGAIALGSKRGLYLSDNCGEQSPSRRRGSLPR